LGVWGEARRRTTRANVEGGRTVRGLACPPLLGAPPARRENSPASRPHVRDCRVRSRLCGMSRHEPRSLPRSPPMRWLFHDPSNRTEAAARKRTLARIDRWWEQFAAKAPALNDLFACKKKWD